MIDNLPHIPLIFLGFYRSVIVKMKAKKISAEEAQLYRYKSKSKSSLKLTLGATGVIGCSHLSSKFIDYVDGLNLFFSDKFYLIFVLSYFSIFLAFLYWYRRRHGFYKLSYDDAKIKVKPKNRKISIIILYHLINFLYLCAILEPFIKITIVLENGGINGGFFLLVICSMLIFVMFAIVPMNIFFGDVAVVKKD